MLDLPFGNMSRTVQNVESLASPDPSEIRHGVSWTFLPFLYFRMADLSHRYPRNGTEGMSEREGLLGVYCTSLELASAVRCYDLVLDVSLWLFECFIHKFTPFLAFLTSAQAHYPD